MHLLLIMRQVYYKYADHIKALRNLGVYVHLITEVASAEQDALLASAHIIPYQCAQQSILALAERIAKKYEIKAVMTFLEPDIILSAEVAEHLNLPGFEKEPALIARDKSKQRALLAKHNLPKPRHQEVTDVQEALDHFDDVFPVIVKPTQAALSLGVRLVQNRIELKDALTALLRFSKENTLHYHEDENPCFALIEDFLPGEEITLDGVVMNGEFILGGIHNKRRNMGPTFEEDMYSLPFKMPQCEQELADIAAQICKALKVKNALFNVEMRQDAEGQFKVLEFSTRLSGAFCYRHIHYVYALDMVGLYTKTLLGLPITPQEKIRLSPTMTTCTKWVHATGTVIDNDAGSARFSPYFEDYYLLAHPGTTLYGHPRDIGCVGRLSLYAPYHELKDTLDLEQHAHEIAEALNIKLQPLP